MRLKSLAVSICAISTIGIGYFLLYSSPKFNNNIIFEAINNSACRPFDSIHGVKYIKSNFVKYKNLSYRSEESMNSNAIFPNYLPENGHLHIESKNKSFVNQGGQIRRLDTSDNKFMETGPFSNGTKSHFSWNNGYLKTNSYQRQPAQKDSNDVRDNSNIDFSVPELSKKFNTERSVTFHSNYDALESFASINTISDYNSNFDFEWNKNKLLHYKNPNEHAEFYDDATNYDFNNVHGPQFDSTNPKLDYQTNYANRGYGKTSFYLNLNGENFEDTDTQSFLSANTLSDRNTYKKVYTQYSDDSDTYAYNEKNFITNSAYINRFRQQMQSQPNLSHIYRSVMNSIESFQNQYVLTSLLNCKFVPQSNAEYLNYEISNKRVANMGYLLDESCHLFPDGEHLFNTYYPYSILAPNYKIDTKLDKSHKAGNWKVASSWLRYGKIEPNITIKNKRSYIFHGKLTNPDIPTNANGFDYKITTNCTLVVNSITKQLISFKVKEITTPTKATKLAFNQYKGLNSAYMKQSVVKATLDNNNNHLNSVPDNFKQNTKYASVKASPIAAKRLYNLIGWNSFDGLDERYYILNKYLIWAGFNHEARFYDKDFGYNPKKTQFSVNAPI